MEKIWFIIAIPITFIGLIVFSFLFGSTFRLWNEGGRFNNDKSNLSLIKTFAIGIVIFIIIGFLVLKCEG